MKKNFARTTMIIAALAVSMAMLLGGCGNPDAEPVATSYSIDSGQQSAAATPAPTDEAVQGGAITVVRERFTVDETMAGLALLGTRPEATAVLGEPASRRDDAENGSEYWDYEGMVLRYDRDARGDKLLASITVTSADISLLRGLRVGDEIYAVMDAFYRDAALEDVLVDGMSVLYRSEASTDVLLPPRGTVSYLLEDVQYERMVEYVCPAQEYPEELIEENPTAYVALPHHVLRFYFVGDALELAELSYITFEEADDGEE